jgi:hypothetical protein
VLAAQGNLHSPTERKPDPLRRYPGVKSLLGRLIAKGIHHKVADQCPTLEGPEFIVHGDEELAVSHRLCLANRHVGIKLCNQLVRQGVGHAGAGNKLLEHCEAVADFVHDHRQRHIKSIGNRSENLARGLFLTSLNLTQIAKRNIGAASDLTEGRTLLLAKVAKDVAYFVSNQNHVCTSSYILNVDNTTHNF